MVRDGAKQGRSHAEQGEKTRKSTPMAELNI